MKKLALVVLTASLAGLLPLVDGQAQEIGKASSPIRIGMIGSLFRDVPDGLLETMSKPFGTLMYTQTGMVGHLQKVAKVNELGQELVDQKLHLGIFHGFEFGWVKEKFPQLKPLVIAVNQHKHLQAYLLVRSDSEIKDFDDLKEKTVNMPRCSKGHCHLFLERRCQECGQCTPQDYLSKVCTGANAAEALDEVVDGTVEAAVVDSVALECYKRGKPGRFESLRVVIESEKFPAGVVVYCPGTLSEKELTKFRDGLLNCHKTILGRQLLTLWKLTGFETIPDDYEENLTDIIKAYPAPEPDEEE
jgi:ABC-type phosphate/phosphonate transport system substrate-binding protein